MGKPLQQYRMLIEYQGEGNERPRCANPLWELTGGRYRSKAAVYRAYKARAKSLDFKILAVELWERPSTLRARRGKAAKSLNWWQK